MDVSVPVPLIQEQTLEVAEIIPQRRIPERIVEPTRDVPVPQIREQIVEVVKSFARSASRNVLSNTLSMCQRLRSWKRSSRQLWPHMNECNRGPSSMWPQSEMSPWSEFQRRSPKRSSTPPFHMARSVPLFLLLQRLLRRSC